MPLETKRQKLESGLNSLGIQWDSNQLELLLEYLAMLERWNKTYNFDRCSRSL